MIFFRGAAILASLLAISGCDRIEKISADDLARAKTECLDTICDGDIEPNFDRATQSLNKINGEWYVGPRRNFPTGRNTASFEWWDHKAVFTQEERPPEMQALGTAGKGYEFSIEVFLRGTNEGQPRSTMYTKLLQLESTGKVIDKKTRRPGLDVWKTSEGGIEESWYVASDLKEPRGDPPVIACRGAEGRCSGGFSWNPKLEISTRFRGSHGQDWPAIYEEITRILATLRRA